MRTETVGTLVCTAIFLSLTGGNGFAQEARPVGVESALYWMAGQVVHLDQSGGELLLRMQPDGATIRLKVDSSALVSKGRNMLELSDVRYGEQVRVGYLTEGNRRVAREIVLQ